MAMRLVLWSLIMLASTALGAEPKRLLILGQKPDGHPPGTHEYLPAQRILVHSLASVPNLNIETASADEPWAEGPERLERADGLLLFVSEGAKWASADPRRHEALTRLAARGGGCVVLHWGMGTKAAEPIPAFLRLFGACHGGPDRKYQVVDTAIRLPHPEHETLRGLGPFQVRDEFYYELKVIQPSDGFVPLWQAAIDGAQHTVAWAWTRPDGGRSCGLSGLHFHANWRRDEYRRLVCQQIVWTLKLPIPSAGLPLPELGQLTPSE